MKRQVRRIQKAIDELIKIQDDGWGIGEVEHVLDRLRSLETFYDTTTGQEIHNGHHD